MVTQRRTPVLFATESQSVFLDETVNMQVRSHISMFLANHACKSESLALHTRIFVMSIVSLVEIFIVPLSNFGGSSKKSAIFASANESQSDLNVLSAVYIESTTMLPFLNVQKIPTPTLPSLLSLNIGPITESSADVAAKVFRSKLKLLWIFGSQGRA